MYDIYENVVKISYMQKIYAVVEKCHVLSGTNAPSGANVILIARNL